MTTKRSHRDHELAASHEQGSLGCFPIVHIIAKMLQMEHKVNIIVYVHMTKRLLPRISAGVSEITRGKENTKKQRTPKIHL